MKYAFRICLLLIMISAYFSATCQSLDEAFKTAKKENKIVMLVIESEKCAQCNDVANLGLSSELAKRVMNASAVLVKVPKIPDELSGPYAVYYLPPDFFGVVYMDADKNVLTVYHGSSSFYKSYLDNLEKAIKEKEAGGGSLNRLVNDYYGKKSGFETSYQLIDKIIKSGLEPKQEVIDELVQKAPADSANSLSFLQFVERAAAELWSLPHQYTIKNLDNYNMSWFRMSAAERSNINNRVFQKSVRKAIANKDVSYMYRVSSARSGMFQSSGPVVMQRVQQETMLQYYKGVMDTGSYLMNASRYYETFFMTIDVDSITKIDSVKKANMFKVPLTPPPSGAPASGGMIMQTQAVSFTPAAAYYENSLNDGAWTIYTYTKSPLYLSKALQWAKRAIEFMETPQAIDTYARILYKTNNRNAAIEWELKAIEMNKARKLSTSEYEKVLAAMKNGADKIDAF